MRCEQYLEQLSPYIDGMLEPAEEQQLKKHLNECESCREELAILQMLTNEMGQMEEVELPDGLHESVMNKIHDMPKSTKKEANRKVQIFKYISTIAAAMLVVVIGINIEDQPNPIVLNEEVPKELANSDIDVADVRMPDEPIKTETFEDMDDTIIDEETVEEVENIEIATLDENLNTVWQVGSSDMQGTVMLIEELISIYNYQIDEMQQTDSSIIYVLSGVTNKDILREELSKVVEINELENTSSDQILIEIKE